MQIYVCIHIHMQIILIKEKDYQLASGGRHEKGLKDDSEGMQGRREMM